VTDISRSPLRPYQLDIVYQFFAQQTAGKRRVLLTAPTGSGKTVIAAEVVRRVLDGGGRVLFLCHRREIVAQTSRKLNEIGLGLEHGIIQAGEMMDERAPVQVASIQTLYMRAIRATTIYLPPADLIVVDECHHAMAQTWAKIIASYPDGALLGLTATPCRGDGRDLGGIFEVLIECPQVPELIQQGFLVGTRVYAPALPDLTGVRVQAGDYVESQLADVMDRPRLVGDIVTHWHRLAEKRKTVVFATGVQHSLHIRDEFCKSGVSCEHIDGSTPKEERDDILRMLAGGVIDVVTNCMVLTEGWDMPEVGCCVLARPTRKMGLYRQMIGRVLRPAAGKPDAIVIDHSGAVHRHGFVEDRVEWTLDPDHHAENPTHAKRSQRDMRSRLVDCSRCGALRVGGEACRHCGFMPSPPPKHLAVVDADLGLVTRNRGVVARQVSQGEMDSWHRQLAFIAAERGYQSGWVAHKFKEKFGIWPLARTVSPETPRPEVRSWVRSRMIAYAKAQHRAAS
jgi:superfamily II DNA or RNA helicase